MIVLCAMAILFDAVGGMAVATALPASTLDGDMSYGVIEAFRVIFDAHFGMGWLVYVVAVLPCSACSRRSPHGSWARPRVARDGEGGRHPGVVRPHEQARRVGEDRRGAGGARDVLDAVLCGSMAFRAGRAPRWRMTDGHRSDRGHLPGGIRAVLPRLPRPGLQEARAFALVPDPGGVPVKAIVAVVGLLVTVATLVVSFFPSSELSARRQRDVRDNPRGELRRVGRHSVRRLRAAA